MPGPLVTQLPEIAGSGEGLSPRVHTNVCLNRRGQSPTGPYPTRPPATTGPRQAVPRAVGAALLAAALLATVAGCQHDREYEARLAVRRVIAAPVGKLPAEMKRTVAMGEYVLPDIEQAVHASPVAGRLRLVELMRRIGSPKSLPLLDLLARWDTDDAVRRRARQAAAAIRL